MFLDIFLLIFSLIIFLFGITFLVGVFSAGPYVPTTFANLEKFSGIVRLKKGMHVVDLGAGDGRLLRFIERKYGIVGTGYEIAPLVYFISKLINYIVDSKVKMRFVSLFKADFHDVDVIFVYLVPFVLKKLSVKLAKECKKGAIIVSQSFQIPGLKLKKKIPRDKEQRISTYYIYEI